MWVVCRGSLRCPGGLGCIGSFSVVCRCLHSYCRKIPPSFFLYWILCLIPPFFCCRTHPSFLPLPPSFLYPNSLQTSNSSPPPTHTQTLVLILLHLYSNLMFPTPLLRQCWPYGVLLTQLQRQPAKTTYQNSPTIIWFIPAMLFLISYTH